MDSTRFRNYLRLLLSSELPTTEFSRLLQHYGRLQALIRSTEHGELMARALAEAPAGQQIDATLAWLQQSQRHHLLTYEDPAYPGSLRQIDTPPPVLLVTGDPALLQRPAIAMVGSRRATAYGEQQARWLAKTLSEAGLIVCSGMARGIDAAAHQGALLGEGLTVAVLGTGPDRVYPDYHQKLAKSIGERGALVTEFLPGMPPLAGNFPQRNRIISGLCLGTVVVEASLRSGSLISARLAMEQNREVFAVPGPATAPTSRGCHWLIKNGAKLVETAGDVLEELELMVPPDEQSAASESFSSRTSGLSREAQQLLGLMSGHSWALDGLIEQTGFAAGKLYSLLTNLEIAGLLKTENGRYICMAEGDLPSHND